MMEPASLPIAYDRQGSGPPMVLLHPVGMDRSWWAPYREAWRARYDVIAVDLRGHGGSNLITGRISLSDLAADVAALLRHLDVGPAILVGVSMGGMIAQKLAIEHPALVRSMVLCATAAAFPDALRARIRARGDTGRQGDMAEVANETLSRWFLPGSSRPDLVDACRRRLLADDWHSWSACWEAISELDTLSSLDAVRPRTLVVAAGADASIPVELAQQIAGAIAEAEFAIVPDTSHFGAFEAVALFKPVFDRFLDSCS